MSKKPAAKGNKDDEGPVAPPIDPKAYVILESADGHQFFVDRNCVRLSKLCKSVLSALQGANAPTNTVEVSSSFVTLPPIGGASAQSSQSKSNGEGMSGGGGTDGVSPSSHTPLDSPRDALFSSALTYPRLILKFLSSAQLSKAIAFMHYKYKYDQEGEKKPQVLFPDGGSGQPTRTESLQWASIAHLLEL